MNVQDHTTQAHDLTIDEIERHIETLTQRICLCPCSCISDTLELSRWKTKRTDLLAIPGQRDGT